jgi:hypothetical protein
MNLPFVDLVIKAKARFFPFGKSKPVAPPMVRVAKSKDQRLSKTVMPSANRAGSASDPFLGVKKSARGLDPSAARPPSERTPEVEIRRTISLQLSDILDQLPNSAIKPTKEFDAARAVVLKASEIEKGMANGKPSVPLASIYEQAPEIFVNAVAPGDATPVLLPYAKVLEQFQNFHVRSDQERDENLPQLDTPILQVTIEDTERFGTEIEPLETSTKPPMKVEPAIAKTIAEAEPEPAVLQLAKPKQKVAEETSTRSRRPKISLRDLETLTSTPAPSPPATPQTPRADGVPTPVAREIPFHLPPNGTGASAAERVPASSGPPVPTSASEPESTVTAPPQEPNKKVTADQPPLPPVPFTVKAPSNDIRPKFTLVPGIEPAAKSEPSPKPPVAPAPAGKGERNIILSLQAVLSELPPFQLNGSPMSVPEDARVEFPSSMIEPQLASGRVTIPARIFERAVPEAYRALFLVDPNETPVTLPLPEIVKQFSDTALRLRADQEEAAVTEKFETPFSLKAEEDAKRFQGGKENAQPASAPDGLRRGERPTPNAQRRTEEKIDPSAGAPAKAEAIDAKRAIARASGLTGVAGCTISFTDGLSLAGNIPGDLQAEGICSIAPALIDKIDNHLEDTRLGGLVAMSLHCGDSSLTFFKQAKLCLTAWHKNGQDLSAETREQLAQLLQQVSQAYPEPSHVDR